MNSSPAKRNCSGVPAGTRGDTNAVLRRPRSTGFPDILAKTPSCRICGVQSRPMNRARALSRGHALDIDTPETQQLALRQERNTRRSGRGSGFAALPEKRRGSEMHSQVRVNSRIRFPSDEIAAGADLVEKTSSCTGHQTSYTAKRRRCRDKAQKMVSKAEGTIVPSLR